jgi:tRNA modification GTPase
LSNGKLNLNQAEAIRDLIDARTTVSARQAARQLGGELSARLEPIRDRLLQVIVVLESALEFVEDDLPQLRKAELQATAAEIANEVGSLASTFSVGHLLREGLKVTIIGRPNVGKSSVFNRLLNWERAIVTEVAGTTRDSLTEPMSVKGVPILLTDTAGVREASDRIESIGVERTRQAIADADLLLVVLDGSAQLSPEDLSVLSCSRTVHHIVALNKSDLGAFDRSVASKVVDGSKIVEVSAVTGSGINELCAAILEPFGPGESESSRLLITDARHYDLLCRAREEINTSVRLFDSNVSEELVLVGLHNALRFIGEITGETTPEDILTRIFSTFCIGK